MWVVCLQIHPLADDIMNDKFNYLNLIFVFMKCLMKESISISCTGYFRKKTLVARIFLKSGSRKRMIGIYTRLSMVFNKPLKCMAVINLAMMV